jgi:hypothetical protein
MEIMVALQEGTVDLCLPGHLSRRRGRRIRAKKLFNCSRYQLRFGNEPFFDSRHFAGVRGSYRAIASAVKKTVAEHFFAPAVPVDLT